MVTRFIAQQAFSPMKQTVDMVVVSILSTIIHQEKVIFSRKKFIAQNIFDVKRIYIEKKRYLN